MIAEATHTFASLRKLHPDFTYTVCADLERRLPAEIESLEDRRRFLKARS